MFAFRKTQIVGISLSREEGAPCGGQAGADIQMGLFLEISDNNVCRVLSTGPSTH